ncbi:hypothetical protein Tco_0154218 [Tanacetum coccineum]
MGDEHLSTFRVEEIVPNPREFEETFDKNKECNLTFCDNSLSGSKDDLTSKDDSILKEDVQEENFRIYSNPLFEFDANFYSSNVNPLFNKMVEDGKNTDSNVSNSDKPVSKENICFNPGDHEEYLNLMRLLCDISSSRPPKNFHANPSSIIESLPTFPISVKHSDSLREEIDIFLVPEDLIPPGIESDLESEGDVIVHNDLFNDDLNPEYECFTFDIEPDMPVINNINELNEDECFDPWGGEINVEVDDSFTFVIQTFLPYLTYPEVSPLLSSTENEDTILTQASSFFIFLLKSRWIDLIFSEDSCVRCFCPSSLELLSLCLPLVWGNSIS